MKVGLAGLLLLVAQVVAAQPTVDRGFFYDISEAYVVTGHATDLSATQRCIGSGRCKEVNPYLLRFEEPVTFAVAKFGVASLGLWATRKFHARHPRWATVLNLGIGSAYLSLAIRNQRIGR